ncbi:unnamed protein product [marine sediment metagenome]|uniref:YjiS-like domain-containing protein n=1 Tax=marine sediment metagenome TaxID=412755 RepID=X1APP6_9ZZZZ
MTALVMNTMGSIESALRTFMTGYALALGKIKANYIDARTRQALTYLSDRDLRDIGLTRDQVSRGEF